MRRKKSRRSTSFKFTEIGSPVYFPVGAATGDTCPATVCAALFDCCTACCAGTSGRDGSFLNLNDARETEGWVSSRGKANRGAEICKFFVARAAVGRTLEAVY